MVLTLRHYGTMVVDTYFRGCRCMPECQHTLIYNQNIHLHLLVHTHIIGLFLLEFKMTISGFILFIYLISVT